MATLNIDDPIDAALFAASRVGGALMSANWDENPEQFHIGMDNLEALRKFLYGLRALQKVKVEASQYGNT